MTLNLEPFDNALIDMLRAQMDDNGDLLRIGDAQAPQPAEGQPGPEMPYASVYPFDGGERDEQPLKTPHAYLEQVYLIRSVGYSRMSARWMADHIRRAIVGRNDSSTAYANDIAATGIGIARRHQLSFGGATREGTVWQVADEFDFWLVPL